MTSLLTPDDLQAYILEHGISARLIRNLGDTSTVPLAASALGVEPRQIIKSLLFLVGPPVITQGLPQPVLAISHGEKQVDHKAIAAHFGVGGKKVKFARADVVLTALGYAAGGVPPFGHSTAVQVIVDSSLVELETYPGGLIYGGGGDDSTMLELTVSELLRVTGATVLKLSAQQQTRQFQNSMEV
jgi:prolyl-tRNA editing enzyme YbaK/EbsC (Cys-tRNA(Pro) deacylase)